MADLIDRQAAIDAASRGCFELRGVFQIIKEEIEALPSAQKVGRWIERDVCVKLNMEWQSAKCSACGKYHTTPYMYYFDLYKFCPNCGAKMEEKDG